MKKTMTEAERHQMTAHTPCLHCDWCRFNLKWHGLAYLSLCTNPQRRQQ